MVNKNNGFILRILSLLVLISTQIINASAIASADRNPVRVNETFELTLNTQTAPTNIPTLDGLPPEIEIISNSNFYQRSSVNGKTTIQAGWRFTLRATKEGIFTIPTFDVDGDKTQILQITVLPAVSTADIGTQQEAIRLTATVDSNEVYIQQQVLYTIRLYRAVQAQYASLTEPVMDGALLERLGEDKQFETELEGVRYIVLERQYAIFPQQKGLQIITPVIFSAEVSDGASRYSSLGRLRARTKKISLSTKEIEIEVKNRPNAVVDWWLPSSQVTLTENWLPQPTEFRVGNPVTWTYTIKAQGLTATQLPELLPTEVKGLKFYPDTATSNNQFDVQGMAGTRIQKIAVVPSKEGILTIPELKVSWWNVLSNKPEVVTLPTRTIEVLPSLDNSLITNTINNVIETENKNTESPTLIASQPENTNGTVRQLLSNNADNELDLWKMISLISLLLWIITALFLALKNKNKSTITPIKVPLYTNATFDDIRQSCRQNSPVKTRKAILNWCSTQQSLQSILSLGELARVLGDSQLANQLKELERALYSTAEDSWNGKKLSSSLKELTRLLSKSSGSEKNSNQLPPLHLIKD